MRDHKLTEPQLERLLRRIIMKFHVHSKWGYAKHFEGTGPDMPACPGNEELLKIFLKEGGFYLTPFNEDDPFVPSFPTPLPEGEEVSVLDHEELLSEGAPFSYKRRRGLLFETEVSNVEEAMNALLDFLDGRHFQHAGCVHPDNSIRYYPAPPEGYGNAALIGDSIDGVVYGVATPPGVSPLMTTLFRRSKHLWEESTPAICVPQGTLVCTGREGWHLVEQMLDKVPGLGIVSQKQYEFWLNDFKLREEE